MDSFVKAVCEWADLLCDGKPCSDEYGVVLDTLKPLKPVKMVKTKLFNRLKAKLTSEGADDPAAEAEMMLDTLSMTLGENNDQVEWMNMFQSKVRSDDSKVQPQPVVSHTTFAVKKPTITLPKCDGRRTVPSVWWAKAKVLLEREFPGEDWFSFVQEALVGEANGVFWSRYKRMVKNGDPIDVEALVEGVIKATKGRQMTNINGP